jgi:hypothetical protein
MRRHGRIDDDDLVEAIDQRDRLEVGERLVAD